MTMKLFTSFLISILLVACSSEGRAEYYCLDRPDVSSIQIDSINKAFSIVLNSEDRRARYSATLYLKSHLGDETVKHYGNLLFKVSNPLSRIKIYESMGFYGGGANASVLAHYLQVEDEIDTKAQIICSLGHIGPNAIQFVRQIRDTKNTYAKHYATRKSQGGSVVVRSSDAEWVIHEDSMPPERFTPIVDESLKRIQVQ